MAWTISSLLAALIWILLCAPRATLRPGETILGTDFQTFPGGKGANQAVAAARLGGHVRMIGRVGEDAFGDELLKPCGKMELIPALCDAPKACLRSGSDHRK